MDKKNKILNRAAVNRENPYRGLFSYQEQDQDLFYGREAEVKSLFKLVKSNFLTVVFGKSGIGKTSLLNAGLFPRLREKGFLPITLRLNYYSSAPPREQIRDIIIGELEKHEIHETGKEEVEAQPLGTEETLWEYCHRVNHVDDTGKSITLVLVFDQFEEFFTLGKNHQGIDELIDELYNLIENQVPLSVKMRILNEEVKFPYSDTKPNARIIISLREDYLPYLNSLKSKIPSIDRVTFRVIQLNGKQAREIIGMPGGIQDENVVNDILHIFHPEVVDKIIPDEKLEIEPSILNLLCYQLVEKGEVKSITQRDKYGIFMDFYYSVMVEFPGEVNEFVESFLLTEGGFRTPFYLERDHPLRDSIEKLVERRILRKGYYGEREYIEIIHDVLAPIIREKRNRRLEEMRRRELGKRLRIRRRTILVISIAWIISILLAVYAFQQRNIALKEKEKVNEQYKIAQIDRLIIEATYTLPTDNVKAIRIAQKAYKMSLPNPPARLIKVLNAAAASILERPFHTANIKHTDMIYSAVFSRDGAKILTCSKDKTAKLWNLKGELLANLNKHTDAVFSAVFSPDGTKILTCSQDKTAKLWDLKGHLLADLNEHIAAVKTAVFSPDGTRIITTSSDYTAKLWNLDGELLSDLNKHTGWVNSAVFSPDGTRILTSSNDGTAKIWLTPEAIIEWLKSANIRQLTKEEKKELGIE